MKTHALKVLSVLFLFVTTIQFATDNPSKEKTNKQTIKVALLLDTSNSMDGLINQAKAQLWEIVNELSYAKYGIEKPNLEIALYEYGNSNLSSREGYIKQVNNPKDERYQWAHFRLAQLYKFNKQQDKSEALFKWAYNNATDKKLKKKAKKQL